VNDINIKVRRSNWDGGWLVECDLGTSHFFDHYVSVKLGPIDRLKGIMIEEKVALAVCDIKKRCLRYQVEEASIKARTVEMQQLADSIDCG
jgi:hypothetical protein